MSWQSPEEIRKAIELAEKYKRECKHEHTIETGYETVECTICGKDLGWWCPDSPNHVCEYYGNHKGGRLIGRQWEFTGEWTDYDDCIYCHQPEERK